MKFGPVPVAEALGAINAHKLALTGATIKKGARIGAAEQAALAAAGIETVIAARLDADDLHEDAAARRIARAAAGSGLRLDPPFTGRVNLFAVEAGILRVDIDTVNAINGIDPAITFATLPQFSAVEPGRMVATAKIIPFGVVADRVETAEATIAEVGPPLCIVPFTAKRVGVISTTLPSLKRKTIEKTLSVLAERLAIAGATIALDERVPHEPQQLAAALRRCRSADVDLIVIFGASAVVDADDVIPAAIRRAGGTVHHFGMPVDPGNLLLTAELDGKRVIGAPGCARSPKENGFDWVLQRLLADIDVTPEDIVAMGVGGLLMEIVSRPQPRDPAEPVGDAAPKIAAVILAGGRSSRMGGPNKMLATLDDKPLVRIAAEAALASQADPVIVVTGHMRDAVTAALDGLDVTFAHNPDFAEGLSTSLRSGIGAVPEECAGAIVMLGDMPRVTGSMVDQLIDAFDPDVGALIVLPTHGGKRGNPVLWSNRYFTDLLQVHGDVGARHLIGDNPDAIVEVELGAAVSLDLDTPDALRRAGGVLPDAD